MFKMERTALQDKRHFSFIGDCFLYLFGMGSLDGNAEAPKVVKFGCVFPLTGPVAAYGEGYKRGVDTMVEYINETGGLKSLGGAKLEVVYGDNQMKPSVAASETERLIEQEKVVAVFGVPPSVTTLAASASAERLKTPFLDPTSFADQLCKRGFKYFFELQPTAFSHRRNTGAFPHLFQQSLRPEHQEGGDHP